MALDFILIILAISHTIVKVAQITRNNSTFFINLFYKWIINSGKLPMKK